MTRRDYILIAEIIKGMPSHAPNLRAQRISCAHAFANRLAELNPAFNSAMFMDNALGANRDTFDLPINA